MTKDTIYQLNMMSKAIVKLTIAIEEDPTLTIQGSSFIRCNVTQNHVFVVTDEISSVTGLKYRMAYLLRWNDTLDDFIQANVRCLDISA